MGSAPGVVRFGELIRRTLLTRGFGGGEVLDDYFPIFDLLADKPELLRLRQENPFTISGRQNGAAGFSVRIWCINRVKGQLVVITGIIPSIGGSAMQVWYSIAKNSINAPPPDGTGSVAVEGTDGRANVNPATSRVVSVVTAASENPVAPLTGGGLITLAANTSIYIPMRVVLPTGFSLVVSADTPGVGFDLRCTFLGYERSAEDAEL
jgi:hypothetical protein